MTVLCHYITCLKYIKEKKNKTKRQQGEIYKSTFIIGNFAISLLILDRTEVDIINKDIKDLNSIISQLYLS